MHGNILKDRQMAGLSGFPVMLKFRAGAYSVSFSGSMSILTTVPGNDMVDFSEIQHVLLQHHDDEMDLPILCENLVNEVDRGKTGTTCSVSGSAIIESPESAVISADLSASWNNYEKAVCVFSSTFLGFTACPCSMDSVRESLKERYPQFRSSASSLPGITHNQRVYFTVEFQYDRAIEQSIRLAIDMAEASLGNVLRFSDSKEETDRIIMDSHSSPLLIEDVLRRGREYSLHLLENLSYIREIHINIRSLESIHPYDAVANATVSR